MDELKCCICGKSLPNRYAVAGKCEDEGCDEVFCSLHWNSGNRKCLKHGWKEAGKTPGENGGGLQGGLPADSKDFKDLKEPAETSGEGLGARFDYGNGEQVSVAGNCREPEKQGLVDKLKGVFRSEKQQNSENSDLLEDNNEKGKAMNKKISKDVAKKIMVKTLQSMKTLGMGASDLFKKLSKSKSPKEMQEVFESQLAVNEEKRKSSQQQLEEIHNKIVALKKKYEEAVGAKKKLIGMELKGLMHSYRSHEREVTVLFGNEKVLMTVQGRFKEIAAYELRGVSEANVEDLIDDLEEAVVEADGVQDVLTDLDRAGRRQNDGETEDDSLDDFLSEFDEVGLPDDVGETEEPDAVPEKKKKDEPLKEADLEDF